MKRTNLIESEKDTILDFVEFQEWESFEKIVTILKERYNAIPILNAEGPESKVWEFLIDDIQLRLFNNPYGNFIKGSTEEQKNLLMRIHKSWPLFD